MSEVLRGFCGFWRVYAWTLELVTDGRAVPLLEMVGVYLCRRRARRAARDWLLNARRGGP